MVSLCLSVHIEIDLTVTGRLPLVGGNSTKKLKSFAGDPKIVVKILRESVDEKDFKQHKDEKKDKEEGGERSRFNLILQSLFPNLSCGFCLLLFCIRF